MLGNSSCQFAYKCLGLLTVLVVMTMMVPAAAQGQPTPPLLQLGSGLID